MSIRTETEPAQRIKSADRVLDLFETLAHEAQGLTFPELQKRLDVPKSSLHGLLAVLVERQYLAFDATLRRYFFGVQLFEHGQSFLKHHADTREARAVMESIVAEVNETAQLGLLRASEGVNLATVECTHPLRLHLEVGRHFAGHATGLGKVLLAHLSEDEVRARVGSGQLERFTPHTVTSVDELVQDLGRIVERGFSLDTEEGILGIFCVGVPIFNSAGRAATGMSITIPTSRLTRELLTKALSSLAAGSVSISRRMGVFTLPPQVEALADPERASVALARTNASDWLPAA